MAALRSPDFQLFSLRDDPDGLWVAEADGEMLGFAFSWVCGGLWFLAELFVSPVHQGRGIGNELLTRTLDQARKVGATNKALITFTFNTISQGLYIRRGLFPRLPIYFFNVKHDALIARFQGEGLRYTDIEQTAAHQASLAQIDASTVGISREKHHRSAQRYDHKRHPLLRRKGLHRLCLRQLEWPHWPSSGCGTQCHGCGFQDYAKDSRRDRSFAGLGLPPRGQRRNAQHCRCARHANHISNGAGIGTRIRRLDSVSPA